MSSKIDLGLLIDALKILTPIAEAIPVLGASVKGSLEAATRILEYAQVSCFSLECFYYSSP
jgi:hypothetical protein